MKPRLGFGSPEVCPEEVCTDTDGGVAPAALHLPEPECELKTPVSLVHLAEQLEAEWAPPAQKPDVSAEVVDLPPLWKSDPVPEPAPVIRPEPPAPSPVPSEPRTSRLHGCKVGAIGFGRQDIAGLAAAMIEERARIEFLPQGEIGGQGEFDLFLINCASVEVMKREATSMKAVLALGTPAIVIGSRAALNLLRGNGDSRTWDFAAKPLHMDELIWRAVNLLARCEELDIPRKLPARVVVADNDPFTRTLIESALARQGFGCELAEDGEAAWAAIEKTEPGAVILDLTLPNRDGFQLMADIRRAPGRKPKVIVLSARQSEADILRAFALGADDYITKPFSPLELHARLTRLLGGGPEGCAPESV